MGLHRDLTGIDAVHPFAYVQDTDPALDPDNHVAADKAWIDTGNANALKLRNATNTAWITVFVGATQVGTSWQSIDAVYDVDDDWVNSDFSEENDWEEITYL